MEQAINLRATPRLPRKASDYWQININHDELITRNIIDVSPSGISFKAPQRSQFEPGQIVDIQIKLDVDKVFETKAQIVWARDQQFGLKFQRLPLAIDTFIMKCINEMVAQGEYSYWEKSAKTTNALSHFRQVSKKWEYNYVISTALGLIAIAAMTAALVMAAFVHQQNHPEQSLRNISSQFFQKFNTGPGN